MTHFTSIMLAGVIAVYGASGASALSYKWADAVSVDPTRSDVATSTSQEFRDDPSSALGAPDVDPTDVLAGGFFSLGRGKYADFTFGSGGPFTGGSIVFEATLNVENGNNPESANVFAFLASDGAPSTNTADDSVESSFVTSVPNTDAQNGFSFNVTSTFDTIRIWDTSGSGDGFDVDAVGVVPLPAAAWLLLGVSGALVAAKRRSARRAA